ncbi:MAG: nucleotidyltransferase family protein [Chloroflexota bacterium]|nr:nucleotidyltransferase family protein [Chloroflexota bacterium]
MAILILAAGAGSRFKTALPADGVPPQKLLAILDGRPVLEHVLERAAALGAAGITVIIGSGAGAQALEERIVWGGARRVRNPRAERGLSGSVRIGLEALASSADVSVEAALILLGDQPRVSVEAMRRLIEATRSAPERPFVAPRYSEGGGSNPLLVRREAWTLAAALRGDRGFGTLLAASPHLVQVVDVPGDNPDVDTPSDLTSLSRA